MSDVEDIDGHRTKRFKHQSYNVQLKDVHAPSVFSRSEVDKTLEDEACLFSAALTHWMQLNLSPSFISFAQKALPLSGSLPLLVHSWREVTDLWLERVDKSDDEALRALFDLLQKLVLDLRLTLFPAYDSIITCLFCFLPRHLSPESLTALLATLSIVFKYLLLPSVPSPDSEGSILPDVFTSTWTHLSGSLVKCNSEVQRATGEVWASVLRRLKRQQRQQCVRDMVKSVVELKSEGMNNVVAWSLVFASKSVAQTLHTCTPSLVISCLEHHLEVQDEQLELTEKLLRRVLTALTHHCAKPDQFTIVAEPILQKLVTLIEKDNASENVRRCLGIVSILSSVRQGSRLTMKQHSQILDMLLKVTYSDATRVPLLTVTVAALSSSESDLSVWMGPGRRAIEHAWASSPTFAIMLTGSLLEAGWGGFKQFSLPPFMIKSFPLLTAGGPDIRAQILRILAKLIKDGVLKDVDEPWRRALTSWVQSWLKNFTVSEESTVALHEVVSVLPIVSSRVYLPQLASIAQDLAEKGAEGLSDYQETWANKTWAFAQIVGVLAKEKQVSSLADFNVARIVALSVNNWHWSDLAMGSVAELVKSCQVASANNINERDEIVERLLRNLKSHSHVVRRSSLELLTSPWLCPAGSNDLLQRCLAAELVPLNLQGVRERILRIGRVGQVIQNGDLKSAELCLAWLLGQLKVNLRPVWSPATEAIASLSQRFPNNVWDSVFFELKSSDDEVRTQLPHWMKKVTEDEDEVRETERCWRDPSAFKTRKLVSTWVSNSICTDRIIEDQMARDRFDASAYEAQLLAAMGEFPSLVEKHSRELVPLLLSFASPESPGRAPRAKLAIWLKLFSKFTNPKAFHASSSVHDLYISLLSDPDRTLQSLALSCLMTYKPSVLLRHHDRLKLLLDDTKWRDEVANLDLQKLEPNERQEFIPVLVRIFFGMMLERKGHGKGADRRSALLSALGSCREEELVLLVDLMIEPFREQVNFELSNIGTWNVGTAVSGVSEKQQVGFLMFLADVLRNLGSKVSKSWPRLLAVTLTLAAQAQQKLPISTGDAMDEAEEDLDEETEEIQSPISLRQMRIIRQLGLKRLAEFFRIPVEFDFAPYIEELFRSIISPRIPLLDCENTQAPSAMFELFDVWATRPDTATFLVRYDDRTLTKIYDCLVSKNVKPAVLLRIFDMVERLLTFSDNEEFADLVMKPYMSGLLNNVATVVKQSTENDSPGGALAQREIAILSELSPHITDGSQAATLLSLFLPHLKKAGRGVPEKAKVDMLKTICNLLPRIPNFVETHSSLCSKTYETLSLLFQFLRGRPGRIALVDAFSVLASMEVTLIPLADLLIALNSYSTTRMEEPDFDRRLSAFANLNENLYIRLSGKEWTPILRNALNFVQDDGELSIRNNASLTMKRFLDSLSDGSAAELQACFVRILFPGLKRCLRSKSDLVRAEVMGVLAYAVDKCNNTNALKEMHILLAGGDEEANFFNNIFHIQIHRRTRALRRLADYCDEPGFRSSTLQEIFIPVVNSFIAASGTTDHHLVNEAINTLGRIANHLSWQAYHSLVQQYIKLATDLSSSERTYTRALVAILDNFHFSMEDTFVEEAAVENDMDDDAEDPDDGKAKTTTKIHDAVNNRLLPNLIKHLEQRDELEDSNRMSIAVGIAKVSLYLPEVSRSLQIPRLLTVLSQIFRSKSQETRDLSRDTLCRIAVILGPSYLPQIIRLLREALLRGPHLHVLAYVSHALLVCVTAPDHVARFEKLDACVSDIVHVSAEVIFGRSGKDVENDGFKTKMKEVRGSLSKGMDSFAILAKSVSPRSISQILLPIKAIMQETEAAKVMQSVDEVLRRLLNGLITNPHLDSKDILAFCHTLISQNARFFQESITPRKRKGKKANDAVVQLQRKVDTINDHYAHNSWRFVSFGLDLFSTAYRRSRFNFHDGEVMARLESLVTVIGNTLYAANGSVISAGLKATAQIIKCPLKNIEKSLPVFVRQTLDIVRQTGSTEAEVAQTALKTLSVIIRDCPESQVKEKDLAFLLEILTPDLEEISRQAAAFALLRAIVSRKFIVPEIYDLMVRVGEIMVTSQSPQVQELCRSVLLQFLLDYPQGKGRLKQQFAFLVKNLSYVFESGRMSVMELFNAIITKFNDDVITEYADMLFVSLVMVIANDDSTKCREMAAQLIKVLVGRVQEDQRRTIMSHVHSWASQHSNLALARVSSQVYGLVIDTLKKDSASYLPVVLDDVNTQIQLAARELERFDKLDEDTNRADGDWQISYQALIVVSKVFQAFPDAIPEHEKIVWPAVAALLLYPHAWVRTVSCRLLGSLFSVTPVAIPDKTLAEDLPLSARGMRGVANALSLQLKSENLDDTLSLQVVKNLFYIGKCFYMTPIHERAADKVEETNGDVDRESDDEAKDDGDDEGTIDNDYPLPWLFSRLSYQARSAQIARRSKKSNLTNWSRQPLAIFRWFAAMASHMEAVHLERYLPHILSPLYRIAEDDTIRDSQMDELKTLAAELQDLVQNKVGTTKFSEIYSRIRQKVVSVQRERRTARAIQVTSNPQAAAKRKMHKNLNKKDNLKRKNNEFAEQKIRMKFSKRRKTE